MAGYRFVCVDANGRWLEVRYAACAGDVEAKGLGCDLLREFPAVLIYGGERKLTMLAQVA
jgi:hypothetical protein